MKKGLIALCAVVAFMAIAYAAATKFTDLTVTGVLTAPNLTLGTAVDVAVTTPTVTGQIVRDSSFKVYIATNTTGVNGWQKVGTQS